MPLAQLLPGSNYLTVAVAATANISAYLSHEQQCADLVIQADTGNSGVIYVTNDGNPPNGTFSNVLRELTAGAFYSAGSATGTAQVNSSKYYVSSTNQTDFAIGEIRWV
jgi:hypothetical protein